MPMQEDAISPGVDLNYVVSTKCARGTQWEPFSVKLKDISNKFCKIFSWDITFSKSLILPSMVS